MTKTVELHVILQRQTSGAHCIICYTVAGRDFPAVSFEKEVVDYLFERIHPHSKKHTKIVTFVGEIEQ